MGLVKCVKLDSVKEKQTLKALKPYLTGSLSKGGCLISALAYCSVPQSVLPILELPYSHFQASCVSLPSNEKTSSTSCNGSW